MRKARVVVAGERGSGKTTKLAKLVQMDPLGILLSQTTNIRVIRNRFPEIQDRIICWNVLMNMYSNFRGMNGNAYIDDIDELPLGMRGLIENGGYDIVGCSYTTPRKTAKTS